MSSHQKAKKKKKITTEKPQIPPQYGIIQTTENENNKQNITLTK